MSCQIIHFLVVITSSLLSKEVKDNDSPVFSLLPDRTYSYWGLLSIGKETLELREGWEEASLWSVFRV